MVHKNSGMTNCIEVYHQSLLSFQATVSPDLIKICNTFTFLNIIESELASTDRLLSFPLKKYVSCKQLVGPYEQGV